MENNKYKGTMYERFDSILTDRMFAADFLVKKLEFIHENIDKDSLSSCMVFLKQLEADLVSKCVTPHLKLSYSNEKNASDLLLSILFQAKRIYNEIRVAWISSRAGYTPTLELCVNDASQRLNENNEFRNVLNRMNFERHIV